MFAMFVGSNQFPGQGKQELQLSFKNGIVFTASYEVI
jgi:hypothetical protein